MTKITLSNMAFHAFHGCLPHEKVLGGQYLVSVALWFDGRAAQISDNIDDTINYQQVYNIVKTEMDTPSSLLENVAYRIANSLKTNILKVEKWEIELSKLNPPLGGITDRATVHLIL
ncbi:7,8-dihydroneopterin aldolase [Bacteroidia bacterium]|nr:7,8-dihydroneopterin aldolase [Bacteroidia bacterium]GHV43723.1 7,8-dihydroneopterin aldolase [Bacteroidia bacterium]